MDDRVKEALFEVYRLMDKAAADQDARGGSDQGARSKTTSGSHMRPLESLICEDLISRGVDPGDISCKGDNLRLPGWFRPSKEWDMLVSSDGYLVAAVELKSISSSFGNNANNRTEEALGSAIDADHAIKNSLIRFQANPPLLAYALVIKTCQQSTSPVRSSNAVYPMDCVYENASYSKRLTELCRRMLAERLYQAVWVVCVDDVNKEIVEPDPFMSYDRFVENIAAAWRVSKF